MLNNNFLSQLTKKYSLSKTLRFELKPVGKTSDFIKLNKVFEKDKNIDKSYHQAKFYFDKLHQEFIKEALSKENVENLKNIFLEFANFLKIKIKEIKVKKDKNKKKDIQKEINNERKKLYSEIAKLFVKTDKEWSKRYKTKENKNKESNESEDGKKEKVKFILSEKIINVLKEKFPKEKNNEFINQEWPSLYIKDELDPNNQVYIFDSFNKFTTYLNKFQQTRENLYKNDGTSTAVATRIVDNFERFIQNSQVFEEKYKNKIKDIGLENYQEIFQLENYLNCFLQDGINEYNTSVGKVNKITKEYRDKNKINKNDLPLFRTLDKQILGEVKKQKELIKKTENQTEEEVFILRFKEFIEMNERDTEEMPGGFSKIKKIIDSLIENDLENEYQGIYLNSTAINTISRRWFKNYEDFIKKLPHSKDKEGGLKVKKFVSLLDVKNAIEKIKENIEKELKEVEESPKLFKEKYYKDSISDRSTDEEKYFAVLENNQDYWKQFLTIWQREFNSLFELDRKINQEKIPAYKSALEEVKNINSFSKNEKDKIRKIKNYCDVALRIYQMSKYFALSDKNREEVPFALSQNFYAQYDNYYQDFEFIRYYNAFRNFITKKPYSEDKMKLNFQSGSLLSGFDKNKESEKLGVILRQEEKYFLGIINKNNRDIFDEKKHKEAYSGAGYEKMVLKLFPNPTRMIPKISFAEKNEKKFGLTEEIKQIKKEYEEFQKIKQQDKKSKITFDKEKLRKLIAYYQKCLEIDSYKNTFGFEWKKAEEYSSMTEFNNDINKKSYNIKFVNIDKNYIEEKVENGELYLFEIYNKDFAPGSSGKYKNIHTLYFLNIFSEKNIKNPIIKLGANAEVFYRKPSLKPQIEIRGIHKNKEITKYKRYTKEKILFHLPIEINFGIDNPKGFNNLINQQIKNNLSDINIIGIDRGERNLLYYTVINQKEEILEHGSLNEINGVNYFTKLVEREVERQKNRQSWQPVAKIKDLKKGYISFVIHKIAELIEKYNAIVVLEDLNMRFKQIRGGIERSIYQQFEKALIDKLGYLVFKTKQNSNELRDPYEPGGVLNGYQLVHPFESFKSMGKQNGILFYTTAEYTSKTDPLTGFRKNLYISNSSPQKKIKEFIKKCKAIGWDKKEQSYFFTYNPTDFDKREYSKDWTVYSKAPRIRREKNNQTGYWDYKPMDLNKKFEELFDLWGFQDQKIDDLKKIILEKDEKGELNGKKLFDGKERNFYESFVYLFNLILQVRNTISSQVKIDKDESGNIKNIEVDSGVDFFASPVKPFFTTLAKKEIKNEKGESIRQEVWNNIKENFSEFKNKFINCDFGGFDSDGVGAYNIAKKGIMILQKINENPNNPDLYIKKEDWDKFLLDNKPNN